MSDPRITIAWDYLEAIEYNYRHAPKIFSKNDDLLIEHNSRMMDGAIKFINTVDKIENEHFKEIMEHLKQAVLDYNNLHTAHSNECGQQFTYHKPEFMSEIGTFIQNYKKNKH